MWGKKSAIKYKTMGMKYQRGDFIYEKGHSYKPEQVLNIYWDNWDPHKMMYL